VKIKASKVTRSTFYVIVKYMQGGGICDYYFKGIGDDFLAQKKRN